MSYRLDVTLPLLPTIEANARRHWSVRNREHKSIRSVMLVMIPARERPAAPLQRAKLTLVRRSAKEPDFDNLANSFKPVLDALTKLGVIADDTPQVVGSPDYEWERAPRKGGEIRIIVQEDTE